ncbi:PAS domain-containing protein [Onishia taeanensis]
MTHPDSPASDARRLTELEDTARRYEALVKEAPTGIVRIDRHGIIQDINPFALSLLGYTHEAIIGRNVACLMASSMGHQHDDFLARYLAGGAPRIVGIGREVEARHRNGQPIPVHLAVSVLHDPQGEVSEFLGILTDLSEVHAARQAIVRERSLLRAILDGSKDPI